MMSALAPPAAGTATTISVVLNVTNKEGESGLITRETRRLENLQRPSMFGVWEKKPPCATDLNNFLQEIKTTPLLSFFGIMARVSLVRASDAVPISITPRNVVGDVAASSRQQMARF